MGAIFLTTADIQAELKKIQPLAMKLMSNERIYSHTLLIWGLLNRTYEITESAIWALDNDRPLSAAAMLRALMETLGVAYYACHQFSTARDQAELAKRIQTLLLGSRAPGATFPSTNILTCIDKASKMFPELRRNYDDLCEVVHPNSMSHFYSGRATGEDRLVDFTLPFYEFKGDDKKKVTNQVGECCHHIQALCAEMIANL